MHQKTYFIKTFGCQMNTADSEKVHMILMGAGLRKVLEPTEADIIILNTCSVRQKGEDRVFGFIHATLNFHKKRSKEGLSPIHTPLFGITGCMVKRTGMSRRHFHSHDEQRERHHAQDIRLLESLGSLENNDDPLFLRSESIDFTFRIEEVSYLTKILSLLYNEDIGNDAKFYEYLQVRQIRENPASANIIIQTGCDNFCSFCIVPYTRGREVSRPMEEILSEVQEQVKSGAKEVTLLGQNVNSYGKETKKKLWNTDEMKWILSSASQTPAYHHTSSSLSYKQIPLLEKKEEKGFTTPFRELLEKLNTVDGLDRIRFTSSNPHDMTRDILDAHFDLPKLCPYLHFALQSGSDTMLRKMNRKHTYEDFRMQVEYLRSRDPFFSISTDIIVGFPGETEEEFEATREAMRECEFDFAYIARYSPRRGTRSSDLSDDIPPMEKARRWSILNDILRESVQKRSERMIGRIESVLVSGHDDDGNAFGRTRNWKEVYFPDERVHIGDIVPVLITHGENWVLKGKLQ